MKKTDVENGAAVNSAFLALAHIITSALGLIVTKLLSVHFSLAAYGTYSQALLVSASAASLSILGLTDAANYFYNRTRDAGRQKACLSAIFSIQYAAGGACAVFILAARGYIGRCFGNDRLAELLPFVALVPVLSNLTAMYQTLFVSIGRAKRIAARNLIVSAVRLMAVIAACFVTGSIATVLIVILFLDIAQTAYFSFLFQKEKYPISVKQADLRLVREVLAFSVPMAVYVLTNSLARNMDQYVVGVLSDTETLAVYANASKMLPFDMLAASLLTVLAPIITRLIGQKNYPEAAEVFRLYLRAGGLFTCILAGGAVAVSRYLMPFLYDEKYMSGLPVFVVYLLIDMMRFANVSAVLSGAGRTRLLMGTAAAALALNGIGNVAAYRLMGIMGPAAATLAVTALMTLALLRFGAEAIHTKMSDLFDFHEMALVGAEIAVFGTAARCLAGFLSGLGLSGAFVLAASYGSYLAVMLGLNAKRAAECLKKLNGYR